MMLISVQPGEEVMESISRQLTDLNVTNGAIASLTCIQRWCRGLRNAVANVVMEGFRALSSFRPTPDGCCVPGAGGWVKSRAQRGRGSDAVGAVDAAGGTRMMGGQELVRVGRAG